jgi:O-antigen/teichoic acid export membrane protein
MIGRQHLCAAVYAAAFAMNLGLCVLLVPRYGGFGAATSTALSLVFETILLFWVMRRLGFHVLAFGGKRGATNP